MSSHDLPSLEHARALADVAELDIAMQVVIQDAAHQHRTLRDRLRECLPALSAQALEQLLKQCRAAAQQGVSLARRVQARILTRREASLALYDQFPGLTRGTSERIIGDSMRRLALSHFTLSASPSGF